MSQQQLNHQSNKSEDIIKKQQKIIEELMERVGEGLLEGTVSALEGELAVVRNVNTLLLRQLDEADSYSRRSCMIVTGSPKSREWWNKRLWWAIRNIGCHEKGRDIRKLFQEACPQNTSHWWWKSRNQTRIIKFTTHSFKEKVFLQHKWNKKIDNGKKKKKSKMQVPDVAG